MSEKKCLSVPDLEEAFYKASLVANGLRGLSMELREIGPGRSTPQDMFALWEQAEALRTILGRAYCGDEEPAAAPGA